MEKLFPTKFAESIGVEFDIIEKHGSGMDHFRHQDTTERMCSFQQMAISCTLEDSLIAFHGVELTEAQMEALTVIHKSTRPWALGNASRILMEKLNSPTLSGKDAKDITEAIKEHLTIGDAPKGKGGVVGAQVGAFTVHVQGSTSE